MAQIDKLLAKLMLGASDANFSFSDLCQILQILGFDVRIKGSHHIFSKEGVEEILNLQPQKGDRSKAKVFQVKQVRAVVLNYKLVNQDDNEV
ncbi:MULTISPECIES: type II toxin-antitoxin system HicA family toxin [unclassified Microcoleus]|uniref:type II toxin-antitoxin system HicA family toxin n=1 Tax=unclassified Microcoleus TaxID=2642155 RepID=UPI002FD0471C